MSGSAMDDDDDDAPVPGATVPLAPATPKQRVLLIIVITLGALILLALGALIVGFVTRATGKATTAETGKPWSYSLDVAPGTHVTSTHLDGTRIVVHLSSPGGDELVLIDAASGKVTGRVRIKPTP